VTLLPFTSVCSALFLESLVSFQTCFPLSAHRGNAHPECPLKIDLRMGHSPVSLTTVSFSLSLRPLHASLETIQVLDHLAKLVFN